MNGADLESDLEWFTYWIYKQINIYSKIEIGAANKHINKHSKKKAIRTRVL